MDKVDKAIERLKVGSEMSLRYYGKPLMITYSGGKDSEVLADLAIKAKIPIEIVNSHTTADAPPTVYHIRNQFKKWENDGIDCKIVYPKYKGISTSMWELIPIKKMPPTRRTRYCCVVFKETTGNGRMIATGVRWAESAVDICPYFIEPELYRGLDCTIRVCSKCKKEFWLEEVDNGT